jgi:hypothetical protein
MMRVVFICVTLAVLSPRYAEAVERMWRVGVLTPVDDGIVRSVMLPYLATRGFVEGRNLVVDFRIGTAEQLPELAQALVGDKPDAIIAISDWALYPARAATSTIPIVAAPIGVDPVRARIAESWAHPGGNVTGVCLIAPELEIKRFSLLRDALPSVHRIAVLSNHRKVIEAGLLPLGKAAAEAGLELVQIWIESPNEYAAAFDAMRGGWRRSTRDRTDAGIISRHRTAQLACGESSITDDRRLSRERPRRLVDWLWPQPQRTWSTGSGLRGAHPQRCANGRVTVSRPHTFRLCYQHKNRHRAWPHDPAVSPRGRR